MNKHCFLYRGFTMHCDPLPTADGRFDSKLVIGRGLEHKERVFCPLGHLDAEEDAANLAFDFGKLWVDCQGDRIGLEAGDVLRAWQAASPKN